MKKTKYENPNILYEDNGYIIKHLSRKLAREITDVFNTDYSDERDYTLLLEDKYPLMLIISDNKVQAILKDEKYNELFYTPFIVQSLNALNMKLSKEIKLPVYRENGLYHVDYEFFNDKQLEDGLAIQSILIHNKEMFGSLSWVLNLWPTYDVMRNMSYIKSGAYPEYATALYESFYAKAILENPKLKKTLKKDVIGSFSFVKSKWSIEVVTHEITHAVIFLSNLLAEKKVNLDKIFTHNLNISNYKALPKEVSVNDEKIAVIFGVLTEVILSLLSEWDDNVTDLFQRVDL